MDLLVNNLAEIGKCYGGGLKGTTLQVHMSRSIRPNANLILAALARGEDPLDTVPIGTEANQEAAQG
jgi:hypothetical protein